MVILPTDAVCVAQTLTLRMYEDVTEDTAYTQCFL